MCDVVVIFGSMVGEEAVRALEEVIILHLAAALAVGVIPGNVNSVPVIVLHFYIIPHMTCGAFFIEVAENADTRDIEPVAHELEGFGIALADNARFNYSTERGAAESCACVIVGEQCYVIMYLFQLFITGITCNRDLVQSFGQLVPVILRLVKRFKALKVSGSYNEGAYLQCVFSRPEV